MTEAPELLIGEFAQRCRLPVSTLRYYDRIGLLPPAVVDESSGYRRYRADQLATAELIARLRTLGVGPPQIAEILAGGDTAATSLLRERRRVSAELEVRRRRLAELDDLLAQSGPARYPVSVSDLTERQVAIRAFSAPFDDQEEVVIAAIGELRSEIRAAGHHRAGAWGGTFPLDLDETVEGFVFAPVSGTDGLTTAVLPGGPAVHTVHRGSLEAISLAYLALFAEMDRLGGKPQGPMIEDYLPRDEGVRISIPFTV
ncbi:MAG TPA: MerR family transcriptional regulator [Sporichthya sp.]|nr:MerR family transcriptional regulator [Sporichthya sp.]